MKSLNEYLEMIRGAVLYPSPAMRLVHIGALVVLLAMVLS